MNTLYIVACAAKQRAVRLPAAQLYIGPLFGAAITHARHFAKREQDVRILSAHQGLLFQGQLLDPYDKHSKTPGDAHLISNIRFELARAALPLRIVMLTGEEDVSLFRAACAATRFEAVPVRAPLLGLSEKQGLEWLQRAKWRVECNAQLPTLSSLHPPEDERLEAAARAAALWWSRQLMRDAPPPDPNLFADALALELRRAWNELYCASRGEWPEDIAFPVEFLNAPTGVIAAALHAIGLDENEWWKREWADQRLKASMLFSMDTVRVQVGDMQHVLHEVRTEVPLGGA